MKDPQNFTRSPLRYDATPEERMQLLVHAVMTAYNIPSHTARQLVGHAVADQLKHVDEEVGRISNPYRMGRGRGWSAGMEAARGVLFMRQLRLRASRLPRPFSYASGGR
jgi:hypothetical protein